MIPATHPVVRAMALEAARESLAAVPQDEGARSLWADLSSRAAYRVVEHHAALLTDFDRPATRDAWVRWGTDHQLARYDVADEERWERLCAKSYDDDVMQVIINARIKWREEDQATIRRNWSDLRDDPEALEAAVCAALETTP